MKRMLILGMAVLVLSLAFTACGGGDDSSSGDYFGAYAALTTTGSDGWSTVLTMAGETDSTDLIKITDMEKLGNIFDWVEDNYYGYSNSYIVEADKTDDYVSLSELKAGFKDEFSAAVPAPFTEAEINSFFSELKSKKVAAYAKKVTFTAPYEVAGQTLGILILGAHKSVVEANN